MTTKTQAQEPMTMTQNGTTTAPRPQLGDIIIHNYGALVYIGTIERFCTHNPNMVEGPALVISSADGKFYECQAAHYFDLRTCKVVGKPPVMPFEGEAVPEAGISASVELPSDDDEYCPRGCGQFSHHPPTGECPVELGLMQPPPMLPAAVAGVDALIDIPEPHIGDGVLGSASDEEPF
jgi:hypothetical protein